MFNLQFAKSLRRQGPSALVHRDARRRHAPKEAQEASSNLLWPANDDLPLIVTKAEEEVRSQLALKRMGYLKVLCAYLRYKRDGRDTFHSFGADHLWPTMDFVRDWLKDERRQFVAQHGWVSLLTLLATLAAGLAFVGVLIVFG